MSEPTDIQIKAAEQLSILKDYAHDLEADLGKVERNRNLNPRADVEPYVGDAPPWDLPQQNNNLRVQTLAEYKRQASAALAPFNGLQLGKDDAAAVGKIRDLVHAINEVTSYGDATALVSGFSE